MARPRSEEADTAIVASTLTLIAEHGIEGLSVEAIASDAGVGKATIYRRYADRDELVSAALSTLNDDMPDVGVDSSATESLIEMLEWIRTRDEKQLGRLLPRILAQAKANPELYELYHARVVGPRRERFHSVLRTGISSGEFRDDIDVELAGMMVVAPMLFLTMMRCGDNDPAPKGTSQRLMDLVLNGIASS